MAVKFFMADGKIISVSELSGKLEGFFSLSTSVTENTFCQIRSKINGFICEHCYAEAGVRRYTNLGKALAKNTEVLTTKLYEVEDFPIIPFSMFRFESHGDLNNVIQARNYIRMAKRNPHCTFTIWTKNYGFLDKAISLEGKPKNMICGISSRFTNVADRHIAARYSWCNFLFTVYTSSYAIANNINMNCPRKCISCMKCYNLENFSEVDGFIEINEILKSDANKISVEGD